VNDTTRRYPRTLRQAFPDQHDWADRSVVSHILGASTHMRPDPKRRLRPAIPLDTSPSARCMRVLRRTWRALRDFLLAPTPWGPK
jgi:hypothetical protein